MIGKALDTLLRKKWSDDKIEAFIGNYRASYISSATDFTLRTAAASGGTTSALLIAGLKLGLFDGAVVCKSILIEGKVRATFTIAKTENEILECCGSKYVETNFARDAVPLIVAFPGKVAVVGLPCDLTYLRHRCSSDDKLKNKVYCMISLFCGHNSSHDLIDGVTARIERKHGCKIISYKFRVGTWRGNLEVALDNGTLLRLPSKYFNDYQNLFFFCQQKCLSCYDHFGYHSDISVGDLWLFRLRNDSHKHSSVIVRTDQGEGLWELSCNLGLLASTKLSIKDILEGQSRSAPSHYNCTAREMAGKLLGVRIKSAVRSSVRWYEYLNALITVANYKISCTEFGKKFIFIIPRRLLKIGLYAKKGLESLP